MDFSLGVTAFGNPWAGRLPDGDYSGEVEVDFARFYSYSGSALNTEPQWSDEFDGNSLDYGKWYTANWTFYATRFRQENIKVQDGRLFLRVNRGESYWNPAASGNAVVLTQSDAPSVSTQSLPELQVIPELVVTPEPQVTSETQVTPELQVTPEIQVIPELEVIQEPSVIPEIQVMGSPVDDSLATAVVVREESVQAGSADAVTLWMLAACGMLAAYRRRIT